MLATDDDYAPAGEPERGNTQADGPRGGLRPGRIIRGGNARHVNAMDALGANSLGETPWMDPPSMRPSPVRMWWLRFRRYLRTRM